MNLMTLVLLVSSFIAVMSIIYLSAKNQSLIEDEDKRKPKKYFVIAGLITTMIFLMVLVNNGAFGQKTLPQFLCGHMEHKNQMIEEYEEVAKPKVNQEKAMGSEELKDSRETLKKTLE